MIVQLGLWQALWAVTSALSCFTSCFPVRLRAGTHHDRVCCDGRSTSALVLINTPSARVLPSLARPGSRSVALRQNFLLRRLSGDIILFIA